MKNTDPTADSTSGPSSRKAWTSVEGSSDHYAAVSRRATESLFARFDDLTILDLDPPVTAPAWERGRRLLWEIADFITSHGSLPRPDVFVTAGELSFEWQPARTGSDVLGVATLSADGTSIETMILRPGEAAPSYERTAPAKDGLRTFLLFLNEEIQRR